MLANGATLGYKEKGAAGEYKVLEGLKEIPEMGTEPEKVENTVLTDKVKQYENGIGDAGDMTYLFSYKNDSATSSYRLMRAAQESGKTYDFEETMSDGTKTRFSAQPAVKRTGGGVNGVIDFNVSMSLQSDIEIVDPEK